MDNHKIYIEGFRELKTKQGIEFIQQGRVLDSVFEITEELTKDNYHIGVKEEQYTLNGAPTKLGSHIESTWKGLIFRKESGQYTENLRNGVELYLKDILDCLRAYTYTKYPFYYIYYSF